MSDQQADTDRIKESAKTLTRIHSDFKNNSNPADDLGVGTLGAQSLIDVFDDFGSNWKIHRERLMEELEKLAKVLTQAGKSYDEIDHALAEALRAKDKPKKGAGK
ncbi:hypothetical protein HUT18_26395 [Streptomyces sp. NA04227]|uniref:hypothetical protein n=1 Tax=Streptomyces sp. NA04227 TaxID=2742136 RepID=UPI001592149A|nr:hypothetical protein [Streptomyces sp. NA04227]QKW09393.1 hypothetical protein HUT18_26395 [Streptomyces sp. NA04227]